MPNRDPDMALVIERPAGVIVHEVTEATVLEVIARVPIVPLDSVWQVVRR